MKTLILTAALVVLATASFSQEATSAMSNEFVMTSDDLSVAFYPNSTDAVTMIMTKDDNKKVKVRVSDSNDKVLYEKSYSKISHTKVKYDVSAFPSGEYIFEVLNGKEVLYTKNFTKRDGSVALVD
jgi:hypothetical protein